MPGCNHDRFLVETLPPRQAPLSIFSRNCKSTRPTVSVNATDATVKRLWRNNLSNIPARRDEAPLPLWERGLG